MLDEEVDATLSLSSSSPFLSRKENRASLSWVSRPSIHPTPHTCMHILGTVLRGSECIQFFPLEQEKEKDEKEKRVLTGTQSKKEEEGIWLGGGGSKKAFVVVVRARRVFAFKAHRGRRRGGGMVLRSTALAWEGGREGVTVQVYNVCEATIISPGEGGSTHKVVFDLI